MVNGYRLGSCGYVTIYYSTAQGCTTKRVQYTVDIVRYTVYNIQCTMYSVQCRVYNVQCTVYTFTMHILYILVHSTHTGKYYSPHSLYPITTTIITHNHYPTTMLTLHQSIIPITPPTNISRYHKQPPLNHHNH